MIIRLNRFYHDLEEGMFGILSFKNVQLVTVECPWKNNQRFVSCVPSGEYELDRHSGISYRNTWALVGETVSHYYDSKSLNNLERYCCVFHVANKASELEGCIAVGTWFGKWDGGLAVIDSAYAMTILRDILDQEEEHQLVITNGYISTPDQIRDAFAPGNFVLPDEEGSS